MIADAVALSRRLRITELVLVLAAMGCGVEAGNPNGNSSGTGTLKLQIAGSYSEGLSLGGASSGFGLTEYALADVPSFRLRIKSIELHGYQDGAEVVSVLQPSRTEVDLLASAEATELLRGAVQPATYERIAVVLDSTRPFEYRRAAGDEVPVAFENDSHRAFYIDEYFTVAVGSSEEVVIDLDLAASLESRDERLVFQPKLRAQIAERLVDYSGRIADGNPVAVCAYAYDIMTSSEDQLRERLRPDPDAEGRFRRPPPPGVSGTRPPIYASKNEIEFDATPVCEGALARTRVNLAGEFYFPRLIAASYVFRAFYRNRTPQNFAEDIVLSAD